MQRKIEVTIPLRGISTGKAEIKTEAHGYVGGTCQQKTAGLLAALGGIKNEELKAEYYQSEEQAIERITDGSG